ncbi:MAG: efflux RND transporter periplasmic adaptor subunit, partial [Vicinamibacterales bacterium]
CVVTCAAGACSRVGSADAPAPAAGQAASAPRPGGAGGGGGAVPVTVTTVTSQAVPVEIQAIGAVEPLATVAVRAQITGELTSVNFREGEDVAKGQELFTLDRRPLEAVLAQAEANLARDVAQAANARAQAVRYQDLAQRGIATKEQVDTTRTAATALEAVVEADKASIENAKVQLQYATITAPLSGRTGALMVHPGSLVRANDTAPLVVINQVSPISVSFSVPERQLPELKQYMARGPVSVHAEVPGDGSKATGRVAFVDNLIDRTTGTIRVKGTFDNRGRQLWPGQFVNVTVTLTTVQNAVTVPSLAVQTGPQGTFIYVVKADQSAEVRLVTVERTRGDTSIIAKGVQPGETVVTDGQLRLTPGSRVSIKTESAGGRS